MAPSLGTNLYLEECTWVFTALLRPPEAQRVYSTVQAHYRSLQIGCRGWCGWRQLIAVSYRNLRMSRPASHGTEHGRSSRPKRPFFLFWCVPCAICRACLISSRDAESFFFVLSFLLLLFLLPFPPQSHCKPLPFASGFASSGVRGSFFCLHTVHTCIPVLGT